MEKKNSKEKEKNIPYVRPFVYITKNNSCNILPKEITEIFFKADIIPKMLKDDGFETEKDIVKYSFFEENLAKEPSIVIKTIFFVSIANEKTQSYETFKKNLATIFSYANTIDESIEILFASDVTKHMADLAEAIGKIRELWSYRCDTYISKKQKKIYTPSVITTIPDKKVSKAFHNGFERGKTIGKAINFSRYLSDLPANVLYPESFISFVTKKFEEEKISFSKTIFDEKQVEKMGMGGITAVGKGSDQPPYLAIFHYKPEKSSGKKIALVGKGVTFDTGGISIKPSQNMEDMKADMSGAANVIGAFYALSKLKSDKELYAVVPLAENMVSSKATRPGDIIRFYNGKTAEVKNTDAEGRLILADALAYTSQEIKPDVIIDLATLTGAATIALGPVYAGLMSENNTLTKDIIQAGEETGERCWRLPLEEAYEANMHSHFADFANIGTKGYRAGTTMGGMFLREFVSKDIPWAHLDIANVATDCPFKSYLPSFGATGFGVDLITKLLS
jgi:leucyl aminopeptidase